MGKEHEVFTANENGELISDGERSSLGPRVTMINVKFGCATPTTPKVVQFHDFIEKMVLKRALIFDKSLFLYVKNYSLQAIATELGTSKSVVRTALLQGGVELRGHSYKALKQSRRKQTMSDKTAPYGFCLIQGKRVEDPREQVVLKLILKWSSEGLSHCGIANKLNDKKMKPRRQLSGASRPLT